MQFHLSEGFMPIKQKSSLPGTLSGLGLTARDHSAIASAIAPLMALFVSTAAPRPALGQTAKDKKTERFALYAPQRAVMALADGGLPPLLRFAARGGRGGPGRVASATPQWQALLAALRPEPAQPSPPLMREPITGIASMYKPCAAGAAAEDAETASGERYDAQSWTAAIQIGLRARFGGVGFGRNYRRAFALVESAGRRAIVKINDVGPLAPGRVIDLNERAMRYFDETLELGLLVNVRVTPLAGSQWTPGPVEDTLIAAPQHPAREQLAVNLN
jgi:peptidoglycan lytic transglycosylase